MNKRIKDLAEQAGFIGQGFQNTVPGTCQETALKNFAELIVQECGRYLDSPEFIGRRDLDWSIVLNEYFGVGE